MNPKTKVLLHSYYHKTSYTHLGHAKRAAERHSKGRAAELGISYVAIAYDEYMEKYGHLTKKVTNLMSGKEIEISINTPNCCDPSSETYWSM